MKKLLRGIVEFQKKTLPEQRERFAQLALEQRPDTLFIACSDSRVAPNVFASTDPGDMFVVRNVGNLVAPCGPNGVSSGDLSEAAAIEFAVNGLRVQDIVICGHSECGAMYAISSQADLAELPNLRAWLRFGGNAAASTKTSHFIPGVELPAHNQLSQRNVLLQLENVLTYPSVRRRVAEGSLRLHAWWFDIAAGEVRAFDPEANDYVDIDEAFVEKILRSHN